MVCLVCLREELWRLFVDVLVFHDNAGQSDGIEQTRALAEDYAEQAIAAISPFPDSEAKDGLIEMAVKTLKRRK